MAVIDRSFAIAIDLYESRRFAEADAVCASILRVREDEPTVWHLRAMVALNSADSAKGLTFSRRAVALAPNRAAFPNTTGVAIRGCLDMAEASPWFRRATAIDAGNGEALFNVAAGYVSRGRNDAERALRQAMALAPDVADGHRIVAGWHMRRGADDLARRSSLRGLALSADLAASWNDLATVSARRGKLADGKAQSRRAIALSPEMPEAHNNLGTVEAALSLAASGRDRFRRALALRPSFSDADSNFLFASTYDDRVRHDELFRAQRAWARRQTPSAPVALSPRRPDRDRKLKLGYVSADFREHPVAFNVEGLIGGHDRGSFDVFLYSSVAHGDAMTGRFRAMVDRWTSIADLDDEAAATAIRDDEIDVLVGLAPHTAGNRPRILAYRPAPVQAALYDVGSTGLRQVDLWLTDRVLHPSDTKERFVERLAYLPTLYLHAKPEGAPPPGPPPSLAQAPITFGSCNNPAKLSASTVALWSHVLHAVPNSRLMLKFGDRFRDSDVVRIVGGRFADRGIGAERLWLRGGALDRIRQLALLHDVDIALDPVPFNGCTTTFEALWMGVPVVTLAGDRFVGRIGASLLTASGIPELIADTPDDYVAKAAALAQDGDRLAGYRRDLRARVEASLLCDSAAHARAVEAVLRAAWHEWCRRQ